MMSSVCHSLCFTNFCRNASEAGSGEIFAQFGEMGRAADFKNNLFGRRVKITFLFKWVAIFTNVNSEGPHFGDFSFKLTLLFERDIALWKHPMIETVCCAISVIYNQHKGHN